MRNRRTNERDTPRARQVHPLGGDDAASARSFADLLKRVASAPEVQPPTVGPPGTGADPFVRAQPVVAGDVIAGRFRVERAVATGGSGALFRATDLAAGQPIALKILARITAQWERRFAREASVLESLAHPRIVRYVGHGAVPPALAFLAMEWLDGQTLANHLDQQIRVPLRPAIAVVREVADGLAVAHRAGIVHRDVTPSNVMLVDGDVSDPRVIDFGIARAISSSAPLSHSTAAIGTTAYMAPERLRGDMQIDPRWDVFALGTILFECIVGHTPFVGRNDVELVTRILVEPPPRLSSLTQVGRVLDDLVAAMLDRDPTRRPADALEVREALDALLG